MKKKAIVVSAFYSERLNSRPYIAEKYFKERNYDVKVICSDFSHSLKKEQKYKDKKNKYIIKTLRYKKNMSLLRILSHIKFALDAKKIIEKEAVDIIYINLPPNILGYLLTKNKKCKVILDIIDLWPEALPLPSITKRLFNFSLGRIWKSFRTIAIRESDFVSTHVNYFYRYLSLEKKSNSEVIYLCKDSEVNPVNDKKNKNIKIAYLGNISHIYDFDSLIYIAKELNATIEIIGTGEKEKWLIDKLNEERIDYNFYGPIYNENEKREILEKCEFGFNGYKNSTDVAMSYKSIDYFSYNLPIINSAKGDTWDFVEKEKVGINYNSSDLNNLIEEFNNLALEGKNMNENVRKIFSKHFTYKSYKNRVDKSLIGVV